VGKAVSSKNLYVTFMFGAAHLWLNVNNSSLRGSKMRLSLSIWRGLARAGCIYKPLRLRRFFLITTLTPRSLSKNFEDTLHVERGSVPKTTYSMQMSARRKRSDKSRGHRAMSQSCLFWNDAQTIVMPVSTSFPQ
jgi:hypothetical protein